MHDGDKLSDRPVPVNRAVRQFGITLSHAAWGKFQTPNFKLQLNFNTQFLNSQPTQLLKPQLHAAANDLSAAQ
jgi:hypothetical protein